MISDPVDISSGTVEDHFKTTSEPRFGFQATTFLCLTTSVGHAAWFIYLSSHVGNTYNIGDTERVTKEQFIDFMVVNYPDHFEWLLFHNEWL